MNTFEMEAAAIVNAGQRMNWRHFRAVIGAIAHIADNGGKLIVTGVGKSAIAARKIAATCSTCNIPAVFIDPIGLYHGELGAVSARDAALLISHSGETEELLRLVPFLVSKECLLLSIVGDTDSTLGKLPLALCTGVTEEAFERVPSVSFAATVAIGDAIAFAVARYRGEHAESLAVNHPGGTIGKGL